MHTWTKSCWLYFHALQLGSKRDSNELGGPAGKTILAISNSTVPGLMRGQDHRMGQPMIVQDCQICTMCPQATITELRSPQTKRRSCHFHYLPTMDLLGCAICFQVFVDLWNIICHTWKSFSNLFPSSQISVTQLCHGRYYTFDQMWWHTPFIRNHQQQVGGVADVLIPVDNRPIFSS